MECEEIKKEIISNLLFSVSHTVVKKQSDLTAVSTCFYTFVFIFHLGRGKYTTIYFGCQ